MSSYPQNRIDAVAANPQGVYIVSGSNRELKREAILKLARMWHCNETTDCVECKQITVLAHPDLIVIQPEETKSIGIAQTKELIIQLGRRNYSAKGQRVVIIDPAESMTTEAQNSLLKCLEELPLNTQLFLLTKRGDQLLPTVQSRAQMIQFEDTTKQNSQLEGVISEAMSASPFDRIVQAQNMDMGQEVQEFIEAFSDYLSQELRKAVSLDDQVRIQTVAQQQAYLEKFTRWQTANVPIKTALTGLMLAL